MVTIEDFSKLDIQIGEILSVERVPDTDRLLRLSVDLGEAEPRTVVSGIAEYFPDVHVLVGKKCAFVTNLEPRSIRGIESQGMILTAHSGEHFSLLEVSAQVSSGSKVK